MEMMTTEQLRMVQEVKRKLMVDAEKKINLELSKMVKEFSGVDYKLDNQVLVQTLTTEQRNSRADECLDEVKQWRINKEKEEARRQLVEFDQMVANGEISGTVRKYKRSNIKNPF